MSGFRSPEPEGWFLLSVSPCLPYLARRPVCPAAPERPRKEQVEELSSDAALACFGNFTEKFGKGYIGSLRFADPDYKI